MNKKPHKHAELIKAWADGAEIQFYDKSRGCWQDSVSPVWEMHTEYRIKPEPKPDYMSTYLGYCASDNVFKWL